MARKAHRWLGIGLLLLVGLTAALLYAVQRGEEEVGEPTPPPEPAPARPAPARRAAAAPRRPAPPQGQSRLTRIRRAVPPPEVDAGAARREPLGVHSARSAVPVEIAEEKDPARRAHLMRMHRLAVARSRASRLRRRHRLLDTTLKRARHESNWSAERISRVENDLRELQRGIEHAEEQVRRAEERVNRATPQPGAP